MPRINRRSFIVSCAIMWTAFCIRQSQRCYATLKHCIEADYRQFISTGILSAPYAADITFITHTAYHQPVTLTRGRERYLRFLKTTRLLLRAYLWWTCRLDRAELLITRIRLEQSHANTGRRAHMLVEWELVAPASSTHPSIWRRLWNARLAFTAQPTELRFASYSETDRTDDTLLTAISHYEVGEDGEITRHVIDQIVPPVTPRVVRFIRAIRRVVRSGPDIPLPVPTPLHSLHRCCAGDAGKKAH